jgi:type IV secretory pathway TraG/TraD family ATPase VirD4
MSSILAGAHDPRSRPTHTHPRTQHPGSWSPTTTESVGEREAPLLLAQDALQLAEERAIAFTAGRPPLLLERGDWRLSKELADRQGRPVPALPTVPGLLPAMRPRRGARPGRGGRRSDSRR